MVNTEAGLYYWLPWDTPHVVILDGNYNTWGVTWQPVVQPRLRVHHGQGRLGHAGGWISGNLEERLGPDSGAKILALKLAWDTILIL